MRKPPRHLLPLLASLSAGCLDLDPTKYAFAVDGSVLVSTATDCERRCDTPPVTRCLSGTSLEAFPSTGRCSANSGCGYNPVVVSCASACDAGACVGEPCTGVFCDRPPAGSCEDSRHARVFQPAGSCSLGACSYSSVLVECAGSCVNGACAGNSCEGKSCTTPPESSCLDATKLRFWVTPGGCTEGVCRYQSAELTCMNGCSNGTCLGEPCQGQVCNQPPANSCLDDQTVSSFESTGTCAKGICTHAPKRIICANNEHCAAGRCVVKAAQCTAASCANGCCEGEMCRGVADQSNALCGLGGATCGGCGSGFTCSNGGCADVDECQVVHGGCHVNASCTNTPGSRICRCGSGFSGDGITCARADAGTDAAIDAGVNSLDAGLNGVDAGKDAGIDAGVNVGCLSVNPMPLVASAELECTPAEVTVQMFNSCLTPIEVNALTITNGGNAPAGTGSCNTAGGCPQFTLGAVLDAGVLGMFGTRTAKILFRPYEMDFVDGEASVTWKSEGVTSETATRLQGLGAARTSACMMKATCPAAMSVTPNTTVTLAPTVSKAIGATTCGWRPGTRPATSSGTFGSPASCSSSTYFADVAGVHDVKFKVTDATGTSSECTTAITVQPTASLWVEATWDKNNDVDLHLLHPDAGSPTAATSWGDLGSASRYDCYYKNKQPNWLGPAQSNPVLDRDDTMFKGPENIRMEVANQALTYSIGVHWFEQKTAQSPLTATLKVYCGGALAATRTRSMNLAKDMWVVGTVKFESSTTCTFTPIDSVLQVPLQ